MAHCRICDDEITVPIDGWDEHNKLGVLCILCERPSEPDYDYPSEGCIICGDPAFEHVLLPSKNREAACDECQEDYELL